MCKQRTGTHDAIYDPVVHCLFSSIGIGMVMMNLQENISLGIGIDMSDGVLSTGISVDKDGGPSLP